MKTPMHISLPRNKKGRDFLLGDLHGETDLLVRALKRLDFDTRKDRVISVGDLVDRGPDSMGALSLVEEDWFFAVRGNHEEMLASNDPLVRELHFRQGGAWAMKLKSKDREKAIERARKLPYAITIKGPERELVGVCHAEWPGRDWREVEKALQRSRLRKSMVWGRKRIRSRKPQKDKSAALLVHGHTPLDKPVKLGCALFIDTGAVYGGKLTLMPLKEALVFN